MISHSSYFSFDTSALYLPTPILITIASSTSNGSCVMDARSSKSSKSQPTPSKVPVSFKTFFKLSTNLSSSQPPISVNLLSAIK